MTLYAWTKNYRNRFLIGFIALALTNLLSYWVPTLLKRAIDDLGGRADNLSLGQIASLIFAVAAVQAGIRISSRLLIFNAARDIEGDIRQALFRHLLSWRPVQLEKHGTGDLQSRLTNDLTNVRLMFGAGLLNLVNTVTSYTIALPLMLAQSRVLTMVALIPYPLVIIVMRILAKRIFTLSAQTQVRLGSLSNMVSEDLGARLFITAANLGSLEERRFAEHNDAYLEANLGLVRNRALMQPLVGLLSSLGVALVLLVGGGEVIAGKLTLGTLVAFTSYLGLMAWPTLMFGFMLAMWQRGAASYKRLQNLLGEPSWESPATSLQIPARGAIELIDLSVRRGDKDVLQHVSLTIPAGTRVGIVGEVGSGKSTLLNVLARLIEVPAQTYRIDSQDVTGMSLASARQAIALVPQQPFLFSLPIRDNIAFARPDATDAEIEKAAAAADISKDIARFPEGYQTLVGERGVTLSGGQRQRLALARALLSDPTMLLLDDSFSAVDAETERRIIASLIDGWSGRTLVIATHRLAVLDHVDRVIVLERGQIVEDGTAAELLAQDSRYAELYRKQRLREQVASHGFVAESVNEPIRQGAA